MSNSHRETTLPSSARVTLRNLTLDELDMIGSASGARASGPAMQAALTRVLQSCTVKVEDPGPYTTFTWNNTVAADHIWGLLQLRVASKGVNLPYPHTCEECGEVFEAPVNLGTVDEGGNLNVVPIPPETLAALKLGGTVRRKLRNGDEVDIKQLLVADSAKTAKLIDSMKTSPIKAAFLARCSAVHKPDGTIVNTAAGVSAYLGGLDLDSIDDFQDALAEVDGGVEDFVEDLVCPNCDHANTVAVMSFFSAPAFWGLKARGKKRSRS